MSQDESLLIRCKRLSPNITEYFDGMRYLGELDDADQATPALLNRMAVSMIMDELATIGIVSGFEVEDFITDPANFEAMFSMREKFDRVNLYEFFKSMTTEQYSVVSSIVDETVLDGDILLELVVYLQNTFPLDMHFAQMLDCVNHWTSTSNFRAHLQAIGRRIDNTDMSKAIVDDNNVEDIAKFLKKIRTHEQAVHACVDYLLKVYNDLKENDLRKEADKYDHGKLDPELLPLFAPYVERDDEEEPWFIKNHHIVTNHHVEHWEYLFDNKKIIQFRKEHAALILIGLAIDGVSIERVRSELGRLRRVIPVASYQYIEEMATRHYNFIKEIANEVIQG